MAEKQKKTAANSKSDAAKKEQQEKREPVIYLGPPVRMAGIPVHLATNQTWTARPGLSKDLQFLYPFFVPPGKACKKTRKTLKNQWPKALEKLAALTKRKEDER